LVAPPSPTVSFAKPLTPVEAATPFTPTSEVVSLLQRETPPNPASWSVPGRDLDTNNTVTQANTLATQELTIALRNWQPVLVK
jgi:ADP-ribose pyrophosphatase YjhB (NUDIX family)